MPRPRTEFVCQACGQAAPRWTGQCPSCGSWNTLVETVAAGRDRRRERGPAPAPAAGSRPEALAAIGSATVGRNASGIGELDRVLGGGLVPGSLVLLGGEPGIGKSTLLLQAAAGVAATAAAAGSAEPAVLYATGEESAAQVRLRAGRLGLLDGIAGRRVHVVAESEVARITEHARMLRPGLLVVDSIQTLTTDELDGPAGSVGQVRESALRLMNLAKGEELTVLLVGHVTKDGTLAGPRTLEHLVDVVLGLEGERTGSLRLLRAAKNRFGSTEELGVFAMAEAGLVEVTDPARAFLVEHDAPAPGSVVAATLEGTRPLLVEVQALVAPSAYGTPRRTASGVDANRLALLVAVLDRRAGVRLGSHDVYANLAGGLTVEEPALDLPLALALASSLRDRPVPADVVAFGEVGLLGELRSVGGLERRLREAARLGFRRALIARPPRETRAAAVDGVSIVPVASLRDALGIALG